MKSDWLPTMPLHVAIWSQIVSDSDLSFEDQGKALRMLAAAWSSGELVRRPWASEESWRAAERMWPGIAEARAGCEVRHAERVETGRKGGLARAKLQAELEAELQAKLKHTKPKPKPEPNPKPIRRRGMRLPDDAVLTDEWRKVAADEGVPSSEVETLFREFVGYWTSLPGQKATKLDWLATWRNRCIAKAPSYRKPVSPDRPDLRNSRAPVEPVTRGAESNVVTPDWKVRAYQERLKREREAAEA